MQRIIDYIYRKAKSTKFLARVVTQENFFASKVPVSSPYVSSMSVVSRPGLNNQSRQVQINKAATNKKNLKKVALLLK